MIQFNLLPDVKVQYVKAKKSKRLVIVISVLTVIATGSLLAVMFSVSLYQKHHIADLDKDIKSYESGLQKTPDLAKILTIQNQLNSLPDLYAKRPLTSRLFKYIEATTPTQLSVSHMTLDYTASTLVVSGTSDTLESVNRYVDTLKFTTYIGIDDTTISKAFSGIVLTSFSRDSKTAAYTVTLTFDPLIFDNTKEITLIVPKTITTRSQTELPGSGVFDSKGTK